jgi:hypothetical protein
MQRFSVNGQLQRNHEVQKKARKSLGPDISSPQAVNDNNIPADLQSGARIGSRRRPHPEPCTLKTAISLCAQIQSSIDPRARKSKPYLFLKFVTHHGYWACERRCGGKAELGRWAEAKAKMVGTIQRKKSESDLTPRHATGSSAPQARTKRCARQIPRCPPYLIRESGIPEKCELELSDSPFQNTRFPNECEELEFVDWSAQLIHKKFTKSSHTGPPTASLSASEPLPKFHASLDTGEKLSSHAIGTPHTPLCRSWLVPELRGPGPKCARVHGLARILVCAAGSQVSSRCGNAPNGPFAWVCPTSSDSSNDRATCRLAS